MTNIMFSESADNLKEKRYASTRSVMCSVIKVHLFVSFSVYVYVIPLTPTLYIYWWTAMFVIPIYIILPTLLVFWANSRSCLYCRKFGAANKCFFNRLLSQLYCSLFVKSLMCPFILLLNGWTISPMYCDPQTWQ